MSAAVTAEESVALMVGDAYSGKSGAPVSSPEVTTECDKYEFDAEFQTKIATHVARDLEFMRKAGHLIKPEFFENAGEAAMVNLSLRYYKQYNTVPDKIVAADLLKADVAAKIIRSDVKTLAIEAFKEIYLKGAGLGNGDYMAQRVAEFAQHQAVGQAILDSVDLLQAKQMNKIIEKVKAAVELGINKNGEEYDYFAKIEERTAERQDRALGKIPPQGITTGMVKLDELLYHRGWGRRELSVVLGGPKSGKTTALINFAKAASLAGKNVLYVTCEVSAKIISERLDACMSDTEVKQLMDRMHDVSGKIIALRHRAGALKIAEFPSGTLTPAMLRALIERYKSPAILADGSTRPAIQFDEIVVDYADIMAPDFRTNDGIENSKSIWLALRAIAMEENVAMLSATQGNRDGAKSAVMKAEHVADDYNKVRTVDILISINVSDEERANGEARLFFAASRNQEGGFTVFIKQELQKMKFISSIVRIE